MSAPLLAAKLVELRQSRGISQKEIADYLGITREAYSHYERNTREPNLEMMMKLAKFYQIEISELMNETTIPITSNTPLSGAVSTSSPFESVLVGGGMAMGTTIISNNIHHFLKLFTGRNIKLDLTNITKEDIAVLAQYKSLDKQRQKEVHQFIQFKHSQRKRKR